MIGTTVLMVTISLNRPSYITLDAQGNIFFTDTLVIIASAR